MSRLQSECSRLFLHEAYTTGNLNLLLLAGLFSRMQGKQAKWEVGGEWEQELAQEWEMDWAEVWEAQAWAPQVQVWLAPAQLSEELLAVSGRDPQCNGSMRSNRTPNQRHQIHSRMAQAAVHSLIAASHPRIYK